MLRVSDQPFHYFEVFQYAVLLISTGLLTELFARSNRAHKQAVKILEYKHRLSLEFTNTDDWEALVQKLATMPSKITDVEETYLLINNPLSGKFETAGHWTERHRLPQTSNGIPQSHAGNVWRNLLVIKLHFTYAIMTIFLHIMCTAWKCPIKTFQLQFLNSG